MITDAKVQAVLCKYQCVKLSPILNDQNSCDFEPAYDISFQNIFHPFLRDSRHGLDLCPFGEVIDYYNSVLRLSFGQRERLDYIDSLLGKGPQINYGSLFFYGEMVLVAELLAFVTPSHIFL